MATGIHCPKSIYISAEEQPEPSTICPQALEQQSNVYKEMVKVDDIKSDYVIQQLFSIFNEFVYLDTSQTNMNIQRNDCFYQPLHTYKVYHSIRC